MNDPMQPSPPPPPGPPAGPPPATGRPGNSWDRRNELGFGGAFIEAVKEFVTNPSGAFARTRESGDFAGPLLFGVVIVSVMAVVNNIWNAVLGSSIYSFLPPEVLEQVEAYGGASFGGTSMVFGIITGVFFGIIVWVVWTAILHACILVVGGLKDSTAGFEGTFRVVMFSSVSQLAGLVPIFGGLVAFVWSFILMVIGLASLHRTTTGNAVVAVLIPYVLCCICLAAVFALAIGGGLAAAAAAG